MSNQNEHVLHAYSVKILIALLFSYIYHIPVNVLPKVAA